MTLLGLLFVACCQDPAPSAPGAPAPLDVVELKNGDVLHGRVLVAIDGKPLRTFDELPRLLAGRKPGDVVKVTVVRGLPEAPQPIELPIRLTAPGESVRSGS